MTLEPISLSTRRLLPNLPKVREYDHLRRVKAAVDPVEQFFVDEVVAHHSDGPCAPE